MKNCIGHEDYAGGLCPECKLPVDAYGNTEDQFDNCCFPDCGCDGERLCMAKNGASERAVSQNVEGMWLGNTKRQKEARAELIVSVAIAAEKSARETAAEELRQERLARTLPRTTFVIEAATPAEAQRKLAIVAGDADADRYRLWSVTK